MIQFNVQVNKLTDIVKRLEARSSNKLKTLEENYFGSIQQINDLRRNMKTLNDEVALINARLSTGDLGPYDPQHQYKCRGTFVGHQAEIWCLITCGDILITGSSDKTIKVINLFSFKNLSWYLFLVTAVVYFDIRSCSVVTFSKSHSFSNPISFIQTSSGLPVSYCFAQKKSLWL